MTDMTAEQREAAIERLRALKPTRGIWIVKPPGSMIGHPQHCAVKNEKSFDWVATVQVSNVDEWKDNAAFIAAAPEMMQIITSQQSEIAELKRRLEMVRDNLFAVTSYLDLQSASKFGEYRFYPHSETKLRLDEALAATDLNQPLGPGE